MKKKYSRVNILLTILVLIITSFFIIDTQAGIALGATRVIYPEGKKQVQLAVTNNEEQSAFLIQSWIENTNGDKDDSLIITPPLFAMKGKKESTLRILDATNNKYPKDRETLFWLNVKAIPAMEKSKLNENTLQLAIISRIKLYYRPDNLPLAPDKAADKLTFSHDGKKLIISNPTPYYLTVTELRVGTQNAQSALVPPMGKASVNIPTTAGNKITYQTINDYGALSHQVHAIVQ